MAFIFKDRSLIPNWRDFNKTVALGELDTHNRNTPERDTSLLDPYIQEWSDNRTIAHAGDLISNACVLGIDDNESVIDAANFVLQQENAPKSLITVSNGIISPDNQGKIRLLDYNSFEEYEHIISDSFISNQIHSLKKILKQQQKNSIRWVELSRLYAMVGRYDKAEKSMIVAVGLANSNRYVIRSATRLFCHTDNTDKALYYLKKQNNVDLDPWLLSAEISANRLINKTSKYVKKGFQLLQSNKFSNADISELACSIATEEFMYGKRKDSRNLLKKSLLKPNDNTLAQIEFLSTLDNSLGFNIDFNAVKNPFEAKATEAFSRNDWQEAILNAKKWLLDMPFSKRAPVFGSFVASLFMEDYKLSEQFCLLGLYANPNDVTVLNNLVYTYAMQNNVDEANRYLNRLKAVHIQQAEVNQRVALGATIGLVKFREGEIVAGRYFYHNAIEYAKKNNFEYYALLAQIHLLNEEITLNEIDYSALLQSTEKMIKRYNYLPTNVLWSKILKRLKPVDKIIRI